MKQWDIIRPQDRDLHPGIVLSGDEWCASPQTRNLNVLAGSKRSPAEGLKPHQVALNGADGLEFPSAADCRFFHIAAKDSAILTIGRVSPERRRAIGRKLNEILRLPL